jgi:predicted TIM-barrel fold metal-dependent hydrolase
MARDYNIICSDSHVNPPPDFWSEYLPGHLKDMAPRLESGDDADYVVFEGNRKKLNVLAAVGGKRNEDYTPFGRKSDTRPGGWEAKARTEDMDRDGLDGAVIYGGGPLGTRNRELFIASFEAYNRWLADFCSHAPDRLAGIAYLPMTDVAQSIELMRAMAKRGLKGVNIPAFPMSEKAMESGSAVGMQILALTGDPNGPRNYTDAEFDPFWEAAVELDFTVNFHLGARAARLDPAKYMSDLVMTKVAMAEPIALMVYGGLFERHPRLKVVTVESGVGWFAWMAEYMDSIWERHRHWTKNTLKEKPSFYLRRNIYGTFIYDRTGTLNRHLPGGANIMWSSDYPHSETSFPHSREVIARTFEGVPEPERQRIVCGLARELYHFG